MFNAFKYTKQLEEAGFSREQAEIQLQVITEIVEGELATKQDLAILETNLLNIFEQKFTMLDNKIMNFKTDSDNKIMSLENKIIQSEYRLTIKLGGLMVLGFSTMATLMKFWLAAH